MELEQTIHKEGWLRKKGSRVNLWSERYFVLRGPSLFYFMKSTDTEPKGVFMLQPVCKVSEIRSDINKKRKQFLFRITWPLEEENADDSAKQTEADTTKSQPKDQQQQQQRRKMQLSARRNKKELDAYSGGKVAALAVGGVVVGALTAGVGLVAGMVVMGIGAAAGGGASAITQNKSDKEKYLTLACDTYGDAERWIHAIENQINEIGDALLDFPYNQPGCNFGPSDNNIRNVPPEMRLESIEKWLQQSRWKLKSSINGTRIYENDVIDYSAGLEDVTTPTPHLLRVNVPMPHSSPADVFTTVMNMPPCCRTGVIKNYRIVESMDNQTDIIYIELEGVYMTPTHTYPRDLVLVRYWKHNSDGSYVICLDSVEHRDCDLVPGVVRGLLQAVYVISPPKDLEKYDDKSDESLLTFIAQYDPRGWIWEYGGYKSHMLEYFLLHVVDIRDAIDAERFAQIHFDVDYENAVGGTTASKTINGSALAEGGGVEEEETEVVKTMANTPLPTIPSEMWREASASTFRIRGKTYCQDKVKETSRPSLFKLLACDLYETPGNIRNIASHPKNRVFQALQRGEDTWVFVVQIMVPGPPFYSYCAYFEGDKKLIEEDTPFGRVAHPFFNGNDDEFRNNRFKLIPKVVDGNMVVKMAVKDTPTLLGNKLKQYYYKGDNYFELDVDVGSSSVARNVVGLAMGYSKAIVVDMGFCLQGNDEDELPEVLMGASTVCHLDFGTAKKF